MICRHISSPQIYLMIFRHISSLKYIWHYLSSIRQQFVGICPASNIFVKYLSYMYLQTYDQPQMYSSICRQFNLKYVWNYLSSVFHIFAGKHMSSHKYICKIFVIHIFTGVCPASNILVNLQAYIRSQIYLSLFVK